MNKHIYRIVSRQHGRAFDVEMTEPGAPPRIVNTFNKEADAWQWLNAQEQIETFAERLLRNPKGHGRLE
jgi:hypothetical protein